MHWDEVSEQSVATPRRRNFPVLALLGVLACGVFAMIVLTSPAAFVAGGLCCGLAVFGASLWRRHELRTDASEASTRAK